MMISLEDVYKKFGAVSELAQLLETEMGTLLLEAKAAELGLLDGENPEKASEMVSEINRNTLGQLIRKLATQNDYDFIEKLFFFALAERNRLSHSFYRQHNFRRNTSEGRRIMIEDLESIESSLLKAYKLALQLSGIDLANVSEDGLPDRHVKLD